MVDKNNPSQQSNEKKSLQRRAYLHSIGAAGLLSLGVGTVSAQANQRSEVAEEVMIDIPDASPGKELDTAALERVENNTPGLNGIDPDIPGLENIDTITVRSYESGGVSYIVSGSSPRPAEGAEGFSVESGITADGNSDQLAVEVKSNPAVADTQDTGNARSGGDAGSEDTINQRSISPLSFTGSGGSDISLLATEETGEDLVQNYEGGIHAQADTNEWVDDRARHIQTFEWQANSSETNVWSQTGSFSTHWITYDVHQWNLEGNGWSERSFPGDNAYGKSYSQLTKYEDTITKRTQLETDMTMKPNGTFEWWGKVDNQDSDWGASFNLYTDYVDNPSI